MRVTDDTKLVDLTLTEHARTEKAILVSETGDTHTAVWLPLSQIQLHRTDKYGIHEVVCPEWLALDKGLI